MEQFKVHMKSYIMSWMASGTTLHAMFLAYGEKVSQTIDIFFSSYDEFTVIANALIVAAAKIWQDKGEEKQDG